MAFGRKAAQRTFATACRNWSTRGLPLEYSFWIYPEDAGSRVFVRYVDATGEVFDRAIGPLEDRQWRKVTVPMVGGVGGHWGGNNDNKTTEYWRAGLLE